MSNIIDFESPTHRLNDVLFDVKLQDVFSEFRYPNTLFKLPIGTPHYRAVVNQSNGQIISIVGRNYQLITNEKAIEMGKQIFTQLYPNVNPDELIPYKVVAPKSVASAHIDLIHQSVDFKVWGQETWLPFLRTSNSYNRSIALSFEIGFVRKLCSNGVLFNKKSMKLKYLHTKSNRIEIQSDIKQIEAASNVFTDQCTSLKNYTMPKELMFALVCQILNVGLELPNESQFRKKMNSLENLVELTKVLTARYTNELGTNAYTAFNIVTDMVSHQDEYKNLTGYYFNVRSYFAKPTDWMDDFSAKLNDKTFVYTDYLKDTIDRLERIKKQTGFVWELN